MVNLKTEEELVLMRESAQILGRADGEVAKLVKPGVKTLTLDKVAEEYIRDHGAVPSFKNYNGTFPGSLCISVNEVVVHGFPGFTPGIKPPFLFRLSAMSFALMVMAV